MSEKMIQKHVNLTQTNIDILDDLIKDKVGINNYSEAIRYAILALENNQSDNGSVERKINAIAKNVDILLEMTGGSFQALGVNAIGNIEESFVYMDAKQHVENKIQKATTLRSNHKKRINNGSNSSQQDKEKSHVKSDHNKSRFVL